MAMTGSDFKRMLASAQKDLTLPKYQKAPETSPNLVVDTASTIFLTNNGLLAQLTTSEPLSSAPPTTKLRGLLNRALQWWKGRKAEPRLLAIISNPQTIKSLRLDKDAVAKRVQKLKEEGQIALGEQLESELPALLTEQYLLRSKFGKYIEVEEMVSFFDYYLGYFTASWLKNFVRPLPSHAKKLKEKADALKVFDCYLIIHPQPNGKKVEAVNKKTNQEKDPILLGYIIGSKKLFYIDSWLDPELENDLDLEKFLRLGGRVGNLAPVRAPRKKAPAIKLKPSSAKAEPGKVKASTRTTKKDVPKKRVTVKKRPPKKGEL